jgi:hypothetical protein
MLEILRSGHRTRPERVSGICCRAGDGPRGRELEETARARTIANFVLESVPGRGALSTPHIDVFWKVVGVTSFLDSAKNCRVLNGIFARDSVSPSVNRRR